jgi:hypothetical protein
MNGLFSTKFLSPGLCCESHQQDLVYGGTKYSLSHEDLDLRESPYERTFVLQLDQNSFIDGQPPWNPNLSYLSGKLQFINNEVKFCHYSKNKSLDRNTKLMRSRNGIFTQNARLFYPKWEPLKIRMPAWSHDRVLLHINKPIHPGEEFFIDYHWSMESWEEIGGRLTHNYLTSQTICWRETAVKYNYDLQYFYKVKFNKTK